MGEKKEKKEIAKDIVKYCLSTFNDVDEESDSVWKVEIQAKQAVIEQKYNKRVQELQKHFQWKIFNDSIHKTIELNPVEIAIIETPEFFRLKNIKQLGGGCHVYPGAVHTRFEHSIGVCHLAGEFIKNLKEKEEKLHPGTGSDDSKILKEEEMCVRLAGLCHDLGHGPYSHLFESIKGTCLEVQSFDKWKKDDELKKAYIKEKKVPYLEHEDLSVLILKWILVEHFDVLLTFVESGLEEKHVKMIAQMIVPTGEYMSMDEKPFLYEIVANKKSGLDVDKWDYFVRDCHHLGLTNEFDYGRTLKLSCIVKSEDETLHVGFMKKEIQNIYRMFRTRCTLHQKAYKHKVIEGIEMQIADIICEVKGEKIFCGGKSLTEILKESVLSRVEKRDLSGYFNLTDSILDIIHNAGLANEKIRKIMLRELFCHETEEFFTEKEEANKGEKELKKKYPSGDYTVKCVKISYSSEEGENPLHHVYFYDEESLLPVGKFLENNEVQRRLTGLNMSEIHTGYVVRVFSKEPKIKRMKFE